MKTFFGECMDCFAKKRLATTVHRMFASRGFTLIELLVVILIMSIVTAVAVLSIHHQENRQLQTFGRELADNMRAASETALLQSAVLGIAMSDHAYQFMQYQGAEVKQSWQALDQHVLPASLEFSLEIEGKRKILLKGLPQIVISTNGEITPFKLYLAKKGKRPKAVIQTERDGRVSYQELA